MTTTAPVPTPVAGPSTLRYGGLVVVMLLSFLLVTAEFLPNGVLTEMAAALGVTPGQAGQTVPETLPLFAMNHVVNSDPEWPDYIVS